MRKIGSAGLALLLLWTLLPAANTASASGTVEIIKPLAAGQATGGGYFPLGDAFDSTDVAWDAVNGVTTGSPGGGAPYYAGRAGYVDFGTDWANVRIESTWTKYYAYTTGNQTPYAELWWDDDTDTVNDSGLTETDINFNSAQGLNTGSSAPWVRDKNFTGNPIVPEGRYLMLRSPSTMTNRATEYAFVGWINRPVTAITVTGAGGADTISVSGGTLQMSAAITPSNAGLQTVTWSATNGTGSATISSGGLLTAVANGTVTVRATAQDGSGVFGTKTVTISNQGGNEPLQIITPTAFGSPNGFPMAGAFDNQPTLDGNTGNPIGTGTGTEAPYYGNRVGYIDFGTDWNKVRILSTWTQYRTWSSGNQTPYAELWWDNDTDTVNDSALTETRINFNGAQGLNTGNTTSWIRDNDVSGNAVTPQSRYLMLRSPSTMTTRALEYAFIGWIDANGNGVQNAPFTAVSSITVTGAGGKTSIMMDETLQMSASVLPYIATNKAVTWSVVNGTGSATISSTGLLTPVSDGNVTVRATAQDGSNVFGSLQIGISLYESFVLPVQTVNGGPAISYENIQTAFPNVNWQTLERLYIPAGHYNFIRIINLPQRTAENPLIITNYGGQVEVSSDNNVTIFIGGGSHWILTGEYNEELKTGHEDYIGHADGNYANSAGNYGIESGRSSYQVSPAGVAVTGFATDFEISFIEIHHSGFAGLMIKTDNQPTATMDDVKVHDLYIHDVEAEGMYIGNTQGMANQHIITDLKIYNNRVLRTGSEGIQLAHMGDGLEVHNNVVAMCSLDWKDPWQAWYQDGCFQYHQRVGSAEIRDNVFIGGAGDAFELSLSKDAGDVNPPGSEVWVHDNYFSHGRDFFLWAWDAPTNPSTTVRFEDNIFRQFNFQYGELPGKTDANKLMIVPNVTNAFTIKDNVKDGSKVFVDRVNGDNGTSSNVTATGNATLSTVAPIVFEDVTFPANFDWTKIERWASVSGQYGGAPIYYNQGDYVYYHLTGQLYLCIEPGAHTGKNPTTNPSTWQLVPMMADDFRTDATSPYQGIGLLD